MISMGIQDQGLYAGHPTLFVELAKWQGSQEPYGTLAENLVSKIKMMSLKSYGRPYKHVVLRNIHSIKDHDYITSLTYQLADKNNFIVTVEQSAEQSFPLVSRCLVSLYLKHVETRDPFMVQDVISAYHKKHLIALRCQVESASELPDWDRFLQWLRISHLCPIYMIPKAQRNYAQLAKSVKNHCLKMNYLFCDKLDQRIGTIQNE